MKRLWVAAALAPLTFAAMTAATTARADTTISSGTTTPVQTSSAGNVTISGTGSIKPTASGAAVTINSNNSVINNGTILFHDVNDAQGILVQPGFTGGVANTGPITVTESTSGTSTNQNITTGPFANGANRTGILIGNGSGGVVTGGVASSGSITVVGENSAGISILDGVSLTGDLVSTGTITVTGGTPTYSGKNVTNAGNVTYGVHAAGAVAGNVIIGSTVSATGQNAVGIALGDVGQQVTIESSVSVTGFRSTTAPTDPTILDKLNPDQTLAGGPALELGGNVANGVNITAASAAVGNVAAVPQATLTVSGSAPAVLIGGAGDTVIGGLGNGTGSSVVVGGVVLGNGVYRNFSATGIQIGGTNPLPVEASGVLADHAFGAVTLTNGMTVSGAVTAASVGNISGESDATAIWIGSGATVGNATTGLTVTGNITAVTRSSALVSEGSGKNGAFGSSLQVPVLTTGVYIEPGASLLTLTNKGNIVAAIGGIATAVNFNASGGTEGQAAAINDQSGSLTTVNNASVISASITPIVPGESVQTANAAALAMYLTAGNVTVAQGLDFGNGTVTAGNATSGPSIIGEVVFANTTAGSQNLNIQAGSVAGAVTFDGTGANSLTINGGSIVSGPLAQAVGGQLGITVSNGTLDMTAPTANTRGGPAASIPVSNLSVGGTGQIDFAIDPTKPDLANGQFDVSGNATFASGSLIGVSVVNKLTSPGNLTFTLVHVENTGVLDVAQGGALTGNTSLPWLYAGAVMPSGNDLILSLSLKAPSELGLSNAGEAAFPAIYAAMSNDPALESVILSQTTQHGFAHIYNQLLPDYAGGSFESLATAQRSLAKVQSEVPAKLETNQTRGWVQEIGFLSQRDTNAVADGYQAQGFGLAGGAERASPNGAVGLTAAFISTGVSNDTQASDGQVSALAFEAGAYWRHNYGGLNISANVNGGYVASGEHRNVVNQTSAGAITLLRQAESQWSGAIASGQIGVSYDANIGRFFLRPAAYADYIMLYEGSHTEHGGEAPASQGGGDAVNLAINSRTSTEASATAQVTMGYTFGSAMLWRPELTVGWRQILTEGPAKTTARFIGDPTGSSFTLAPDLGDRGGLLARLGLRAMGQYADITADAGGEFRDGYQTYDARAVARFLF
jgi:hypothetical protein